MKFQTSVKTYYYESVLFDTGKGSNTMEDTGFHFDEINIDGMQLVGNHEYPLTFNLDQTKVIGTAFMRIEHGKLLGNLKSFTPLTGMYPNIGFQSHETVIKKNVETKEVRITVNECSLRAVGVGPGENTDPNVSRIGKPTEITYEVSDEIAPDYDAGL